MENIVLHKMPGSLRFSREGTWFHDGEEMTHPGIREYFGKHLRFSDDLGLFVVEVNGKAVSVDVEDTPIVVRTIDTTTQPWTLLLTNGRECPLDVRNLTVEDGERWYVTTDCGRARLSRSAVQCFVQYVEEAENGGYELTLFGASIRF